MPMYEYTCKTCDAMFEVLTKSVSSPAPICPSCGGEVSRLFSTFATVSSSSSKSVSAPASGGCCGGGCGCS